MGARQSQEVKDAIKWYMAAKKINPDMTPHYVAKAFGLSPSTLYRALQRKEKKA